MHWWTQVNVRADNKFQFRANVKQCGHGISLRSLFSQHWFTWTCQRPEPVRISLIHHSQRNQIVIFLSFHADILHSVLGFPSECVYNNIVRTCTLSFSCWIQGGRYAKGCGENKWLFSCCVPEADSAAAELMASFANPYYENEIPTRFTVTKLKTKYAPPLPQPPSTSVTQNMLRRRIDDDPVRHFHYRIPNQFDGDSILTFFRLTTSAAFHEQFTTHCRNELLAVEKHDLASIRGKHTFASLATNAVVFWYHVISL